MSGNKRKATSPPRQYTEADREQARKRKRTRRDLDALKTDPFPALNPDIWTCILQHVEMQDLGRFMRVSNLWRHQVHAYVGTTNGATGVFPQEWRPDFQGLSDRNANDRPEMLRRARAKMIECARYDKIVSGRASSCRRVRSQWVDVQGDWMAWDMNPTVYLQRLGFKHDGAPYQVVTIHVPDDGSRRSRENRFHLSAGGYLLVNDFLDLDDDDMLEYIEASRVYSTETGTRLWHKPAGNGTVGTTRLLAMSASKMYAVVGGDRLVTTDLQTGVDEHNPLMENDALRRFDPNCTQVVRCGNSEAIVTLAECGPGTGQVVGGWDGTPMRYDGLQIIRPSDSRVQQRIPGGRRWATAVMVMVNPENAAEFAVKTDWHTPPRLLWKFEIFRAVQNGVFARASTDIVELDGNDLDNYPVAGDPDLDPFRHLYLYGVDDNFKPTVYAMMRTNAPIALLRPNGQPIEPGIQVNRQFQGRHQGARITLPPQYTGGASGERRAFNPPNNWQGCALAFRGRDRIGVFYSTGNGQGVDFVFDFAPRIPFQPGVAFSQQRGYCPEL